MESKEFIDCYLRGTTGCIKQAGEFCERCPLINYMRPRPITEVESFRSRAIEELEGTKHQETESMPVGHGVYNSIINSIIEKLKNLK